MDNFLNTMGAGGAVGESAVLMLDVGLTDPAAPEHGYTHVYVPYCTGDLHWGNATVRYQEGVTIESEEQYKRRSKRWATELHAMLTNDGFWCVALMASKTRAPWTHFMRLMMRGDDHYQR